MAEAFHAPHLAQGLGKGVAETNAHVLDGVVVIHPGVTGAGHGEVKGPVAGKAREHVVEEPDAGLDVVFSRPVQVQGQGDVGLAGLAPDVALSHLTRPPRPEFPPPR